MEDADFREKWKYKEIAKKILGFTEVFDFLGLRDRVQDGLELGEGYWRS